MNSKAEWGRNKIPRLINDPEETKYTDKNSQDQLKLGKKRYPEGFTKTHTQSPSQEIEPQTKSRHLNSPTTHHPETFNGQFKQRKRCRIELETIRNKQESVNGSTRPMATHDTELRHEGNPPQDSQCSKEVKQSKAQLVKKREGLPENSMK